MALEPVLVKTLHDANEQPSLRTSITKYYPETPLVIGSHSSNKPLKDMELMKTKKETGVFCILFWVVLVDAFCISLIVFIGLPHSSVSTPLAVQEVSFIQWIWVQLWSEDPGRGNGNPPGKVFPLLGTYGQEPGGCCTCNSSLCQAQGTGSRWWWLVPAEINVITLSVAQTKRLAGKWAVSVAKCVEGTADSTMRWLLNFTEDTPAFLTGSTMFWWSGVIPPIPKVIWFQKMRSVIWRYCFKEQNWS